MTMATFSPALAEIILALGAMFMLMLGVFCTQGSFRITCYAGVAVILAAAVAAVSAPAAPTEALFGLFITDGFAQFAKVLILLGTALAVLMSMDHLEQERLQRFEVPVLIVLAGLGMCMMVSANDLLSVYLGIELQSLSLYVLAAIHRDNARSSEAGLKYFVLGALSSGMLLYGISLIYGSTGATSFAALAETTAGMEQASTGLIVGLVFLLAGFAFKISAVPFHMWTPDVYEGAPTPVTSFFAVAPKIAALALFIRTMYAPFADVAGDWQQIVIFLSIGSMVLGAVAAIVQTNIKRLMAYSSIGHVGYALVGIAAGASAHPDGAEAQRLLEQQSVQAVLIYLAIYLAMNVGAFAVLLAVRKEEAGVETISDLAGLAKSRPGLALAMLLFMFSLAGIPPLAGFFGKFYVFMAAIEAGLVPLAIIGLLTSVIGAFYYLRIIKVMYADEPQGDYDSYRSPVLLGISLLAAIAVTGFMALPGLALDAAASAATALIG